MSDSYTEIKYIAPPQSRNEAILAATVDGTQYTDPPQSRIEDLLLQVKEKIEQGGGISDYTDLANKPQINSVTLSGDKSSADLGLLPASTRYGASLSTNKYIEPMTGKKLIDTILKDQNGNAMSTIASDQPVIDVGCDSSGLLVTYPSARASVDLSPAMSGKVDKVQGKGLSTEDYTTAEKNKLANIDPNIDSTPTSESSHPVSSGGVYTALAGKIGTSDYATTATAGIVKPDGVTTEVDENGVISVSTFSPTSWDGVQNIVRAGLASKFFKVRDQLQCMRGNTVLTWDIIGIDEETPTDTQFTHSLTLGLHDCFAELQYDNREALFAFPNGLAAGEYHFTIGVQPWFAGDVNKVVQFTLTQAIPAGGQLVVNNDYNATMIGATISAFASGTATTATETVTMTAGSGGTDLGTLTAADSGNLNSIHRGLLGSNNYSQSAMRQLINSDKAAGSVWTPQTKFDRPPSWAANTAGFLHGMDPDFVAVLGKVKKRTALNTVSDGGGYVDTIEKVFLLSQTEVYSGLNNNVNEGGPYRYFSKFSDLTAAGGGADANRIKYRNGAAKYWWLRSPYTGYAHYVRSINPSGALGYSYATYSIEVAPVVAIV